MIDIKQEELEMVEEVIENYLSNLNMEISHTDSKDYREKLKRKRELLQGALASFHSQPEKPSSNFPKTPPLQ